MHLTRFSLAFILSLAAAVWAAPCTAPAQQVPAAGSAHHGIDMTVAAPETVGFSAERLERLHAWIQQDVDERKIAGAVTILARHGRVVDYRTYGYRDLETKSGMTKDVIFRDYSMTKPVTGVAMMILYEEGKWLPSDPIAKYVPEFAHLKVYQGMGADGKPILVDPDHAPTMRELMSHTAGFTYGFFGDTPVDRMMRDAQLFNSADLHTFITKLAQLPLAYQPGKGWMYSVSMDIEGYIVEKLSGQTLPDFVRDHITAPLGMRDAGFFVPEGKRGRFATLYRPDEHGDLVAGPTKDGIATDYAAQPGMPSGGGGLVSSAEDYYRFAQMLLNGGTLNGKRILAPATVHLMTTNHVPNELLTGQYSIGLMVMRPGFGYGYNCAVEFDPAEANLPDGKGTFLWDGAAGTWFWVDPANDLVFIGMIQRWLGPTSPPLEYGSRALVYQALVDPSR